MRLESLFDLTKDCLSCEEHQGFSPVDEHPTMGKNLSNERLQADF